ncbi:G-protein-signaling modulator 1 [Betta splendens]|uniref:G-protein-signaling modulator 1 n=1 Tax=Betta splendens TaxID=158456 RepID=A0A6P7KNG2_BETSP|nr:G-protein-signaling modulator 1 [Betta splendens]XP_028984104.1 G-protein-signaling modulator 1 [Betta splendens]XP_055359012.1 G-protein-signaling modulator 1 [Betta splendens]
MAEDGLLEPLIITEEGDVTTGLNEGEAASAMAVIIQSCSGESSPNKEERRGGETEGEESIVRKICSEDLEKQQAAREEKQHEEVAVNEKDKKENDEPEETETTSDGQSTRDTEGKGQMDKVLAVSEKASDTGDKDTQSDPRVEMRLKSDGTERPEEDSTQARRLTPDFPETLYELLCTLQEGRRLNDQRCSFRLESGVRRRRCHSEPNTTKPCNRVVFSSMTSLQKEEFFDLVATAQARRLDDQRAQLERSEPPKPKARSFRGSLKQISFVKKPAPVVVPKEDLYDMILTTQAQGRLEDQRSRAPGPMDDEDFFSLLLRVQGGRMDEQRTELPCMLQT